MIDYTGFDFETHPIGPGSMAPPPVAGAFSKSRSLNRTQILVRGDEMFERLRTMYRDEHHVGQNVAYDNVVTLYHYPELIPLIFDAYHEKRVHDVAINEGLYNLSVIGEIGSGEKRESLAHLAELAHKYKGLDISAMKSGSGSWRVRYHELDGIALEHWPPEARDYLQQDAWLAREIRMEQEDSPVEWLHTAAAFCYRLMTVRGLKIDRKRTRWLWDKVERELAPESLPLLYEHGIIIPAQGPTPHAGGHRVHVVGCSKKKHLCSCPVKMNAPQPERLAKNEALVPRVMRACAENNLEVPMTDPSESYPNGQVKVDEETIHMLAGFDPVLRQYHFRMASDKLRTSYFPAMCWPYGSREVAPVMYPGYEPLKKTGRGSSRGNSKESARKSPPLTVSANIQQADPRMRSCYRPRKGYAYLECDFRAIDLVNLAQTVFTMFGENRLTDHVNDGVDLHAFFATAIAFKKDPYFAKKIRGMTDDDAYAYFKALESAPHKDGCTQDTREAGNKCGEGGCFYTMWRDLAKKAGLAFAGGMGIDTLIALLARELHMKLTPAEAKSIKKTWLQVYPVMRRYLDWAAHNVDNNASGDFNKYYVSPLGMRRTKCSYTECANGNALQSPAAEGMKLAMFLVTRECYDPTKKSVMFGSFPVINMHDALVTEVPLGKGPKHADRVARRQEALMVQGQKVICPDVEVNAKPVLTTRWVKEARQTVQDGLIVPWQWTPKEGDYES